jgi:hypothetical protein
MGPHAVVDIVPLQVRPTRNGRRKWRPPLAATRRDDLEHGTNAAYVHGCIRSECRAHQRIRMARNRD